ncbi:hypothetical protein HY572_06180 [Candidatus Micrarchaeota archaeon]|nr:hypothetical protein [Candidatus Micrarchaeota archaeon]
MTSYPWVYMALALLLVPLATAATPRMLVYKNDACSHCGPYLQQLFAMLEENGVAADQVVVRDYLNSPNDRREVAELQARFGVPLDMQGHMVAVMDGVYVLEGHVPLSVVQGYLNAPKPDQPVVVYQDSMQPNVQTYAVLYAGKRQIYAVNGEPVTPPSEDYSKYVIPAILLAMTGLLAFLGLKKNQSSNGQNGVEMKRKKHG